MFESAELGHALSKEEYAKILPPLRTQLLQAQYDLLEHKKFPVLLIIGGVDGAGKGETVNTLLEWMDPRHVRATAFGPPSDEERERPPMWRFWRALPPKGRVGIFFGSWYTAPIVGRATGELKAGAFESALSEVRRAEQMLADEGVLILKFWFHLSKSRQSKRLKELQKSAKNRWRVTKLEWQRFQNYDKFREISEQALRATSTADAPWIVVEGGDERYRNVTVGQAVEQAIRRRLDTPVHAVAAKAPVTVPSADSKVSLVKSLDLTKNIDKKAYEDELLKYQRKLALLTRSNGFQGRSAIVLFEGSDAAGKGGAIRRITGALDARHYEVVPVAAPSEEEREQPYLWRFWRKVPRQGRLTIFDRSWYGRLLVERVEGFCSEADWMRAYGEINDFEDALVKAGSVVVKFWLQVSPEEQLKRFKEREIIGFKRYKITPDDWRNRERWNDYEVAVGDMIDRTSTHDAPWTLVEANDKYWARVKILRTLVNAIEERL